MIRGAGILFLVGDTALFLRRGNGSSMPNTWCCPGGKIEEGETPEQAAIRETFEEAGIQLKESDLRPWTRTVAPAEAGPVAVSGQVPAEPEDVDFTTYVVRLTEQFTPKLNLDEHDGYCWAPVGGAPQPLHPGMTTALARMDMDELGVARAMAAGQLTSPQRYENVWLFAIRITGTGISYRHARKEFVWRDPSVYINDDFLARCNGLAVIWEHPEKSLLNHKEFADRVIGTIMLPYLRADKPDEVWGIAKVYDEEAAREMCNNVLSTSPAVNFADPSENDRVTLEDGKIMLIEGKPSLLDHIAICAAGVWDKGGDPTGVESVTAVAEADAVVVDPPRNQSYSYILAQAAVLKLSATAYSHN